MVVSPATTYKLKDKSKGIMAMKVEDILAIDCTKEEGKETLNKALYNIKQFAEYKESGKQVPLAKLEKLIDKICRKYYLATQYMWFSRLKENVTWYSVSIKKDDDGEWLGAVYGVSIYELFAKVAIFLYSLIHSGKVKERDENA